MDEYITQVELVKLFKIEEKDIPGFIMKGLPYQRKGGKDIFNLREVIQWRIIENTRHMIYLQRKMSI